MKEVNLTNGLKALVDDEDYERVIKYRWRAVKSLYTFYAHSGCHQNNNVEDLASYVKGTPPKGMTYDHIDGNGLNNQKENLRLATKSQNQANARKRKDNTSGFKGVIPSGRKWRAQISYLGNKICIGTFLTAEEAAKGYDIKAKELFGEFASLNFK